MRCTRWLAVRTYASGGSLRTSRRPELDGVDAAAAAPWSSGYGAVAGGGPLPGRRSPSCWPLLRHPRVARSTGADAGRGGRAAAVPRVPGRAQDDCSVADPPRRTSVAVRLDLSDERAVAGRSRPSSTTSAHRWPRPRRAADGRHGVPCVVGTTEDALFGPVVSFGSVASSPSWSGPRVTASRRWPGTTPTPSSTDPGPRRCCSVIVARPPRHRRARGPAVCVSPGSPTTCPEIVDLELNPVLAQASGAAVLAASAVCAPPARRRDGPARRLS